VRAHLEDAGEGWSNRAKAGKELGKEQGTRALLGENAFGAADTGIGLDGNLAKELKDFDAFAEAELIPERIGTDRGKGNYEERRKDIQLMRASESARGKQERKRGNGNSRLFGEDPGKQDDVAMMEKELDGAVHLALLGPLKLV
jgi:hypothetical protein